MLKWDTVSAAFYEVLQGLEIALRNALDRQLTGCYGAARYGNPAVGLDLGALERVAKARLEIARAGQVWKWQLENDLCGHVKWDPHSWVVVVIATWPDGAERREATSR